MTKELTVKELANMFDHTCLKPYASRADFEKLCDEARTYGFKMVAINSSATKLCKELLAGSDVHVGAAISFPLGQTTIETKVFETKDAIANGADEIDYVINIVELKNGNYSYIEDEMRQIVEICREANVISKVIFENCYQTKDEIKTVAEIAKRVKPDFFKTSTGFGQSGAKLEDIFIMKSVVGDDVKIKAAGGIRDLNTCMAFIAAGVERIGSSSGIEIVEEYKKAAAVVA